MSNITHNATAIALLPLALSLVFPITSHAFNLPGNQSLDIMNKNFRQNRSGIRMQHRARERISHSSGAAATQDNVTITSVNSYQGSHTDSSTNTSSSANFVVSGKVSIGEELDNEATTHYSGVAYDGTTDVISSANISNSLAHQTRLQLAPASNSIPPIRLYYNVHDLEGVGHTLVNNRVYTHNGRNYRINLSKNGTSTNADFFSVNSSGTATPAYSINTVQGQGLTIFQRGTSPNTSKYRLSIPTSGAGSIKVCTQSNGCANSDFSSSTASTIETLTLNTNTAGGQTSITSVSGNIMRPFDIPLFRNQHASNIRIGHMCFGNTSGCTVIGGTQFTFRADISMNNGRTSTISVVKLISGTREAYNMRVTVPPSFRGSSNAPVYTYDLQFALRNADGTANTFHTNYFYITRTTGITATNRNGVSEAIVFAPTSNNGYQLRLGPYAHSRDVTFDFNADGSITMNTQVSDLSQVNSAIFQELRAINGDANNINLNDPNSFIADLDKVLTAGLNQNYQNEISDLLKAAFALISEGTDRSGSTLRGLRADQGAALKRTALLVATTANTAAAAVNALESAVGLTSTSTRVNYNSNLSTVNPTTSASSTGGTTASSINTTSSSDTAKPTETEVEAEMETETTQLKSHETEKGSDTKTSEK